MEGLGRGAGWKLTVKGDSEIEVRENTTRGLRKGIKCQDMMLHQVENPGTTILL